MKRCRAEAIQRQVRNQRSQSSWRGPCSTSAVLASQCRTRRPGALRHHQLLCPASTNVSDQSGPSAGVFASRPAQANTGYRESATYASCRHNLRALMYGFARLGSQPPGRQPNKRIEPFATLTRTALRVPNFVITKSAPHKAAAHARR